MTIYHLNNESFDVNLGIDLKVTQIGHTIFVKTNCEYYSENKQKTFPQGKYKIIDIVHVVEYAAWLQPKHISIINVFLAES